MDQTHTLEMNPKVLVIGKDRGLSDLFEVLLLDRARVSWVEHPNETEGLDVIVVIVDEACSSDDLKQLAVHPGLRDKPVISLGPNDPATPNISMIGTSGSDAVEDIIETLSRLIPSSRAGSSAVSPQATRR